MSIRLVPWQDAVTREIRQRLLVLWSAVLVVLLIGCVNIAGLLLARGAARAPEIATRLAIGGSRNAIVRQLLVESLVLAAAGASAGLGLAIVLARAISGQLADTVALPTTPDLRVLLIAASAALGTSLIFGLFPALAREPHQRTQHARRRRRQRRGTVGRWPTRYSSCRKSRWASCSSSPPGCCFERSTTSCACGPALMRPTSSRAHVVAGCEVRDAGAYRRTLRSQPRTNRATAGR